MSNGMAEFLTGCVIAVVLAFCWPLLIVAFLAWMVYEIWRSEQTN